MNLPKHLLKPLLLHVIVNIRTLNLGPLLDLLLLAKAALDDTLLYKLLQSIIIIIADSFIENFNELFRGHRLRPQ
jgi:hypothetical protein